MMYSRAPMPLVLVCLLALLLSLWMNGTAAAVAAAFQGPTTTTSSSTTGSGGGKTWMKNDHEPRMRARALPPCRPPRLFLFSKGQENLKEEEEEENPDLSEQELSSSSSSLSASNARRTFLSGSAAALTALTLSSGDSDERFSVLPSSTIANALSSEESSRIAVFEKAAPAVVFIDTFAERRDQFTTNLMEIPIGSGSGFIWDKQGHIVTNYHLVRNAQVAQIAILSTPDNKRGTSSSSSITSPPVLPYTSMRSARIDGAVGDGGLSRSVFKATVVGVDPGKDVAVLKVDAPPELLQPIAVGTSRNLLVGQSVLAIGNPFSLSRTLTTGVVSGLGREVKSPIGRPISNVIQTDASINPGNSGGPLLDSSGKLIGMNTAIYSPSGASAGIGFAIPIDTVKYIVEVLIRDGKIVRPLIGITYLESKQAKSLGINSGVLVLDVPEGSAAAKAGLKGTRRTESGLIEIGDIIIQVDDTTIEREADLFRALEDLKPGDTVDITVNRLAASNDELMVKTLVLTVELQSSAEVEKRMQTLYIQPQD